MKKALINCLTCLAAIEFAIALIPAIGANFALAQDEPQATQQEATAAEIDKALTEKWKNLPPQEKERLKEKYKTLKEMTPQERQALKENLKRFKGLPQQKQEMLKQKWQKISPEERQNLRQKYKRLHEMTPQERERFLEKHRKWKGMSDEDKQRLRRKHEIKRDVPKTRLPKAGLKGGKR